MTNYEQIKNLDNIEAMLEFLAEFDKCLFCKKWNSYGGHGGCDSNNTDLDCRSAILKWLDSEWNLI